MPWQRLAISGLHLVAEPTLPLDSHAVNVECKDRRRAASNGPRALKEGTAKLPHLPDQPDKNACPGSPQGM